MCIYYANRHCISHTWINHNDQFLYPKDGWQTDFEFMSDCLIYTLFSDKNRISAEVSLLGSVVEHSRNMTRQSVNEKDSRVKHGNDTTR